ncbi:DUF5615 family PIN-like protein [Marinoscillum sp. MHG1-6]|uniref:DUF5615 family PIN-like protein n=1 Tax=Marinoscillum sp. MHG1-6 TaxID=2959627 RepID=UPI002157494B|nr:DUF5615 family PIN-like protein [Marinoscillum sp. MHG1-6]
MYLIDENLPPVLAELFRRFGLDAKHINEFDHQKPIKDDGIRRYVLRFPETVVVTRDDDFVKSYFSRKVPEKVLYVYNLQVKQEILTAFESHLEEIAHLYPEKELVELNPDGLKIHS